MKIIPNILSIFRILLVPVFIAAYFSDINDIKLYAVLVYALATFSDFLDGYLARKLNASSNLGKVLDPLGDKLMTVSVMICITIDGIIPVWAVIVAVVKELIMAIGGLIMHKLARAEILPSNLIGKTSTVVFFIVCVALMLFKNIPEGAAIALISFAIVLMLIALATYFSTYVSIMKNRERDA